MTLKPNSKVVRDRIQEYIRESVSEEERSRFTNEQAEHLLSSLIYRELLKGIRDFDKHKEYWKYEMVDLCKNGRFVETMTLEKAKEFISKDMTGEYEYYFRKREIH